MSNSPRIPKKITDKNGKDTTVYVSVDSIAGGLKMNRLDGLRVGAPKSFSKEPNVEELAAGTFDPKPFITANGDRVAKAVENDPFYTFLPQPAFDVSREPIPADTTLSFMNPYLGDRRVPYEPFRAATEESIQGAGTGTKIRVGGAAGKTYSKTASGDWMHVDPVGGIDRVPGFWFERKLGEGLIVEVAPIADEFETANSFKFMDSDVEHQYINPNTVRVEVDGGEVAYWNTDGTNDILGGRKGTLTDVTIAITKFANGLPINEDLED